MFKQPRTLQFSLKKGDCHALALELGIACQSLSIRGDLHEIRIRRERVRGCKNFSHAYVGGIFVIAPNPEALAVLFRYVPIVLTSFTYAG